MNTIVREALHADWITLVMLLSMVFIIVAKQMFYTRFLNFIVLPFNNKYLFMYSKRDKLFNWFNIFFAGFQLINLTLFIFYSADILFQADLSSNPINFLIVFSLILLFMLLKIFIQLGNSYVFDSQKTITDIIFKKISYLNFSGFVLFLANILLTFIFEGSVFVVYAGIFLVVAVNTVGWITIFNNHQKYISTYFFYFILYLCALEISPYVLMVYYIKD